ncbi:MAG: GntR family transcriptional regulator, partial [Pseudomonadales bacterium]|nr:GntR family transcriptional regulator [Pseudomonadales bacterium]
MDISWNNKEPIYLQLRDRLVELIIDGVLTEGDALPSVRQISSEQRINPVTVSKAIQLLVDEALVEKRRGLG